MSLQIPRPEGWTPRWEKYMHVMHVTADFLWDQYMRGRAAVTIDSALEAFARDRFGDRYIGLYRPNRLAEDAGTREFIINVGVWLDEREVAEYLKERMRA